MKKVLLFFAVMCCMMVANAEDFTVDGIKYNVTSTENNTVEVVMKGMIGSDFYEGDIVIPATVTNGGVTYNVTGIGEYAFAECSSLTSIILPSGVTSISSDAFNGCSSLASINIPSGVTSISSEAFFGCSSLASINIPSGVTSIGNHAFAGCSSLTDIILPDKLESFGKLSFRLCNNLAYVTFQGTTPPSLPDDSDYYPFNDSGKDVGGTKLYVPNDDAVTAYENAGYTNVYNPLNEFKSEALDEIATAMNGVTLTQDDAAIVSACKESINQATDIETILQERDHALSVINQQKAKESPAKNEIWYTSSDGNVVTPKNSKIFNNRIKGNVYDKETGKGCITLNVEVTSIDIDAFKGCGTLTSIILPSGVKSIEQTAFSYCTSLTSITLPSGLTSIGMAAFSSCTSLASITLPSGLKSIEKGAFSTCTSLTSITLPSGLTSIGSSAFTDCTSLTSINLPNTLESISSQAFYNCSSLTSITLPSGLKSIGSSAFSSCERLTSINLPNTLESIGGQAFRGCSNLTSITLPSSLTEMPSGSQFMECSNLVYVKFLGTTPPSFSTDVEKYYPFYNSGNAVGGTILLVSNENVLSDFTTAGYKNVYVSSASGEELKSQVLDEIDKALDGLELTLDDAALVTACQTNIGKATDVESILSNKTKAFVTINLQKAKDVAIAYIDALIAEQTEGLKKYLEGAAVALWKERINSATDIGYIENEQSLLELKVTNIGMIVESLIDVYISLLSQEDIEAIENHIRNIIEATDEYTPSNEVRAAADNTQPAINKVVRFYLDPINDEDLIKTYLERIDEAFRSSNSKEIFQIIEDAKKENDKWPHFRIGDIFYGVIPVIGYEVNHVAQYYGDISFPDGVLYEANSVSNIMDNFEYTRTLPEGVWQCWYEPFQVYVDTKRFDAAEVAGILTNAQGETVLAFNKLENGAEMRANTIYVVRAKEGHGKLSINPWPKQLNLSTETTLTIQSAYDNYTLTGNYSPVEHGDWYTLDKTGAFRQMADGSLKPQRFYLTITPRTDAYYPKKTAASAPPFIRMTVLGDDDGETTGIESIDNGQLAIDNSQLYDLQGRKVTSIQKGQIYIVNGKKYMAK